MNNYWLVALTIIMPSHSLNAYKKVFLFSPPGSLSVAFTRMMEAYGSFKIIHEPSTCVQGLKQDDIKDWFIPEALTTTTEVKKLIAEVGESSNVFIKEMVVSASKTSYIYDEEFIRNPQVYTIFLLRNPHHQAISVYKRWPAVANYPPGSFGYRSAYDLLQDLQKLSLRKPLVIFSEDLHEKSEETARRVCQFVDIEFKSKMLSWDDLGEKFSGKEWHEKKYPEIVHHWHGPAIRSTSFHKTTAYEVDSEGQPTFSEIKDVAHRASIIAAYLQNKPYYDLIKKTS